MTTNQKIGDTLALDITLEGIPEKRLHEIVSERVSAVALSSVAWRILGLNANYNSATDTTDIFVSVELYKKES